MIIVALTLASSQYTPRILRNLMRDNGNQSVLGVFLGVFAYCLVVLRTIRGRDEGAFLPSFAVFVAVVLAFVAISFFIAGRDAVHRLCLQGNSRRPTVGTGITVRSFRAPFNCLSESIATHPCTVAGDWTAIEWLE